MPDIVIVGAGVIGISSAYALARAGFRVTVVEKNAEAGLGVSLGNGAQLSYAYSDAMASPELLRKLPGILMGADNSHSVALRPDPQFLSWGLRFLRNGTRSRWDGNTARILAIALSSQSLLRDLTAEADFDFSYREAGKLIVYGKPEQFERARSGMRVKLAAGIPQEALSADEARVLEPALLHYGDTIAGAIYSPEDAVGDASAYCAGMREFLQEKYGVRFLLGSGVGRILIKDKVALGVALANDLEVPADLTVWATGAELDRLPRGVNEKRDIWPVRGYSFTVPANENAPRISITDAARKIVFARIGDRLRVAGLADIGGQTFSNDRFDVLSSNSRAVFPQAIPSNIPENARWSGARPMTPDSLPIIKESGALKGLVLNIGHGGLGWTLALGSAERLLSLIRSRTSV